MVDSNTAADNVRLHTSMMIQISALLMELVLSNPIMRFALYRDRFF
jgi:hypothetical protein